MVSVSPDVDREGAIDAWADSIVLALDGVRSAHLA
jgi:hypothetical protein